MQSNFRFFVPAYKIKINNTKIVQRAPINFKQFTLISKFNSKLKILLIFKSYSNFRVFHYYYDDDDEDDDDDDESRLDS